jgi:hypothetical protein
MFFNIEFNLFCNIKEIGENYIIIEANGFTYKSSMDKIVTI